MQKIELRCEICSLKFDSNYNIPKVLSCGHTVCSKCVDRMRDKSINKCPFDRKLLDFEEEQVAINYYILALIDNDVKESAVLHAIQDDEETFEITPRPVINSPGWKNTLDGFIRNGVLYTVETNGFIYCTDLSTGEWWFMYHNQFFGNFFFENKEDGKMYLIDQYGSLFQIFNKNYYVQIGKKNAWRNTTHIAVHNNKLFSLESSNKFYETNLQNGKWREIVISNINSTPKNKRETFTNTYSSSANNFFSKSGGNENFRSRERESNNEDSICSSSIDSASSSIGSKFFKNINMLISTKDSLFFSNKNGELYSYKENTGEARLISKDFNKNIEAYHVNSTHVYYFEKNSKIIYRTVIKSNGVNKSGGMNELLERLEIDLKKQQDRLNLSNKENKNTSNTMLNTITIPQTNTETLNTTVNKDKDNFLQTEVFLNLETENILSVTNSTVITPLKLIVDDKQLVVIDKIGDLYAFSLETKKLMNNFQCLFMLRNCHLSNTALIGDGDLLLLDPIRLSLNKLNIIAGTEVIVLHSTKFLYTIKHIFSANSRIYFIDTSGNLYFFNEVDKKLTQIGNNSICKYIVDFAVYKNYILTIENNTLYRTNLNDGNYIEIKNDYCKNYEYFFADNANIIFISREDEISVTCLNLNTPTNKDFDKAFNDQLRLKKNIKFDKISKMNAVTYFRNHIVFYNKPMKTVESLSIEDGSHKVMVENFPDINMFICNNDFLACISKEGVIYKLYC
jgi:hypothetical protein